MYEIEMELAYGIVEVRKYDDRDKVVEIRKKYPPQHVTGVKAVVRKPGSLGGHEG